MFDMMNEGVSVCMPEDPSGNVKLMFSILECLDKASRNVVTFLMDHIKLVHLNADRNKMTSQALAICFGPLFSCHYESESVHKAIQVFKYLLDIWPARRSFNVKKLDESKGTSLSEMQAMNMASCSGQQSKVLAMQATDRVDRAGYDRALLSQSGALASSSYSYDYGKTCTGSLYGSSPPTSQHRFASSTTTTTTSSTQNTTTTTASRSTASLSGTGSTTGGTGRMLPSTQNATRTISSYTSSEKIEVKVPPGSSGPSVLSPAAKAARDAARDAASSSSDYGYIGTRSAIPATAHSYGASTASSATSSGYRSRLQTSDYDYDLSTTATTTSGGSAYTSVSPRMLSSYTSDLTSGVASGFTSAADSFNVSSSLTATTRSSYLASGAGGGSSSSASSTMANDAIYSTVNKPSSALKSSSYLYGASSQPSTIQSSGPIDVDELLYKSSQLDSFFTQKQQQQQQQQQGSALNSPFVSSSVAQYDTSSISSPLTATRSTYHTGGNIADSSSPFTSMGFTSSVDNFAQARQQPQCSLGGTTGLDNIKPLIGSSGTGATTTQLYPSKMTNSTAPAGDASATNAGGYYAGGSTGRFSNPAGSASSNYRSNHLGGNSFPEEEDDVR